MFQFQDIKEEEFISSPTGSTSSSSSSNKNHLNHQHQPQVSANKPVVSTSRSGTLDNAKSSNNNAATITNHNTTTNSMQDSQLFQEYRKHKAQIIQQIEEQEKKRDEYVKQLKTPNVHNALTTLQFATGGGNGGLSNGQQSGRAIGRGAGTNISNLNEDESFLSPRSPALHTNIGGDPPSTVARSGGGLNHHSANHSVSFQSRDELMRSPMHQHQQHNSEFVSPVSSSASSSSSHVKSNNPSNIQQQQQQYQPPATAIKPSISAN
jgi:hypothetical protein